MENETGKLSFDRLFLLSGIYALFYTVCLYKNKMGITFPVFVLGTAGLFFCSFLCFFCTICMMIRLGTCQNMPFPCAAASSPQ